MRKIQAIGKTDFAHRHIGVRINNKIDFKVRAMSLYFVILFVKFV